MSCSCRLPSVVFAENKSHRARTSTVALANDTKTARARTVGHWSTVDKMRTLGPSVDQTMNHTEGETSGGAARPRDQKI
jgi:hypothetical protein